MKFRGLLIAVAAFGILLGGLWWSEKYESEKEGKPAADAAPKILEIPVDQIRQVEIAKDGEKTVLKRGEGGKYELLAPEKLLADQDAASGVFTLLSSLNSERLVEEKAAEYASYGLVHPKVEVAVTKADGKTVKLLVGDDTPAGSGVYARVEGDPRVFTMASFNKTGVEKSWKDLRDKRMMTFDHDKLTRLELTAKGRTLEFGKNANNEWQFVKPQPLRADGSQVEEIVRKLRDSKMDPLVSDEDARKATAAFASGTPVGTAKVTDAAGTQQLDVRRTKDGAYYMKSSAVDGVHKATSDLGDGVAREMDDLRNHKVFDFGWSDPSKVEFTAAGVTRVFTKSGEKWSSGGQEMDAASVQSLIDKLREMNAVKFPATGFATAEIQAAVTSNEGKRTERVLISKAGTSWVAKRDGEVSLYELDGKFVEELQQAAKDVKAPPPPKKDEKKK